MTIIKKDKTTDLKDLKLKSNVPPNAIPLDAPLSWELPSNAEVKYILLGTSGAKDVPKKMSLNLYSIGIYTYEDFLQKGITLYSPELFEKREKEREEKKKRYEKKLEEDLKEEHRQKVAKILKESNLPYVYRDWTFDKLDESFKKKNEKLLSFLKKYLNTSLPSLEDKIGRSLYFYGEVGNGKTTLLSCMAKFFAEKEYPVFFTNISEIFSRFIKEEEYRNSVLEKRLVFIDDLGKAAYNDNFLSVLYRIVDTRLNEGLLTFWTNNTDLAACCRQLKDKTGDLYTFTALKNRLEGSTIEVKVEGKSYRKVLTLEELDNLLDLEDEKERN